MKTMLLTLMAAAAAALWPQSSPSAPAAAAAAKKPELTVSIGVPEHYGKRIVRFNDAESHFPVVVTNVSDHPLKLWREWCSWGWDSLSFEISMPDGPVIEIRKRGRDWYKNFPDYWTLAPGESLVLDAAVASYAWENFPLPKRGGDGNVRMRARFRIEPDLASDKEGVWTGEVVSEARDYVIENRMK